MLHQFAMSDEKMRARALAPGRQYIAAVEIVQNTVRWLRRSRQISRDSLIEIPRNSLPPRIEIPSDPPSPAIRSTSRSSSRTGSSPTWRDAKQRSSPSPTFADVLGIGSPRNSLTNSSIEEVHVPAVTPRHDDAGPEADYWDQADMTMHTRVGWHLRRKLRTHPIILDELEKCTYCVLPKGASSNLNFKDYTQLQLTLYKALVPKFNEKDARKCAKEDWQTDCKGEDGMNREHLKDSIFELADNWTRSIDPREYFGFLRTLFTSMCVGDPPRLRPLDQVNTCAALLDGCFDEEDMSAELLASFDSAQASIERATKEAAAAAEKAAAKAVAAATEEAERQRLLTLDPFYAEKGAVQNEVDAVTARLEELRRRQALGLLTAEELAELERLETRLAQLQTVQAALELGSERDALATRLAELQRRQELGLLTDEERNELEALHRQMAEMHAAAEALGAEQDRLAEAQRSFEAFCNASLLDDDGVVNGGTARRVRFAVAGAGEPPTLVRLRQLCRVHQQVGMCSVPHRKFVDAWVPTTSPRVDRTVLGLIEQRALGKARRESTAAALEVAEAEADAAAREAHIARYQAALCVEERRLVDPSIVVAATVAAAHANLEAMAKAAARSRAMAQVEAAAFGQPMPPQASPSTLASIASLPSPSRDINFGTCCLRVAKRVNTPRESSFVPSLARVPRAQAEGEICIKMPTVTPLRRPRSVQSSVRSSHTATSNYNMTYNRRSLHGCEPAWAIAPPMALSPGSYRDGSMRPRSSASGSHRGSPRHQKLGLRASDRASYTSAPAASESQAIAPWTPTSSGSCA